MQSKQLLLDQIAADIVTDNICPDLAKQATQLVMGDGNPNADIVFIGEAPGKQEDIQGKPFIGASGKFLDELFKSVNMNRQDVFITSILKYRPPANRDPSTAEKQAFWPYMVRQLEVIEPTVVVTLGRHSMLQFLPEAEIGQVHGQIKRITLSGSTVELPLIVLPFYHPAAAIYNRSLRATLFEDFAKLPKIINEIKKS